MTQLSPGDMAPDFQLESTRGTVSLKETLATCEKGVIVYFYPKAMTPGCTTEACDFRDGTLSQSGYHIIGISPDQVPALNEFEQAHDLNFTLASDPDHSVMSAYGAWGEKKNYGKTVIGVIRSTVIINPDGTVKEALYNVKATGHVKRVTKNLIG